MSNQIYVLQQSTVLVAAAEQIYDGGYREKLSKFWNFRLHNISKSTNFL